MRSVTDFRIEVMHPCDEGIAAILEFSRIYQKQVVELSLHLCARLVLMVPAVLLVVFGVVTLQGR